MADLETFINENQNSINTTLFTSVLDMMKSIESQINLQRIKRSQTGRVFFLEYICTQFAKTTVQNFYL